MKTISRLLIACFALISLALAAAAAAAERLRPVWLAALPLVLLRPMIAIAAFAVRPCEWQPEPRMFT